MDPQVGQNDSRMWNKSQTLKNINSMFSIQKYYSVQYHIQYFGSPRHILAVLIQLTN